MAHGGSRPGAGRRKGIASRKNRETVEKAEAGGITPLDYMLQVLRDPESKPEDRKWASATAAPYVHARLQSTTVKGEGEDGSILIEIVA